MFVAAGLLIGLLVGAGVVAAKRAWFSPTDLSVGSHHPATLRQVQLCPKPAPPFWEVTYAGRKWQPYNFSLDGFGDGPIHGTLVITTPLTSPGEGRNANNAQFVFAKTTMALYGGSTSIPTTCPASR